MKKIFTIIMLTLVLSGCGKQKENTTDKKELEKKVVEAPKKETRQLKVGDTIKTSKSEITIKKIEFSYNVLPDDTSNAYTHYPAESGKVYIHIDTDVKNIQKQQLKCEEIMTVIADYNNGYEYKANVVPEDASLGFTYANITTIDPLVTLGVRFLIDAPQEVEESKNPLKLVFDIDGEKYEYIMR